MKFVSPAQRGTTCMWMWYSDAGARDPALVDADVVAVRGVAGLEGGDAALREGRHLGDRLSIECLQLRDVLVGRHHQVPVRIGVLVEHHEAAPAAVNDQVRLVIVALDGGAEDALALLVLGCVLHVLEAPRRPDSLRGHTMHRINGFNRCSGLVAARTSRGGGTRRASRPSARPSRRSGPRRSCPRRSSGHRRRAGRRSCPRCSPRASREGRRC